MPPRRPIGSRRVVELRRRRLVHQIDALFLQGNQQIVELVGIDFLVGQIVVDFVVGQIALRLSPGDQFLQILIEKVHRTYSFRASVRWVKDVSGASPSCICASVDRPVRRHPHPSVGLEMPCRLRSLLADDRLEQCGLLSVIQSSFAQRHDLCGTLPLDLLSLKVSTSSFNNASGSADGWPLACPLSSSSTNRLFMAGSSNSSISRSNVGTMPSSASRQQVS